MVPDLLELLARERPGLAQHVLVDAELADVVQERRLGQADRALRAPAARERELLGQPGDALRVTLGAGILGVELLRERAQARDAAVDLGLELGSSPSSSVLYRNVASPPELFAWTSATSASASSSSGPPTSSKSQTPAETVTWPMPSIGVAASARRARSAAIQPFRPSVSGRIQPKWSAESRETSSPLRTVAAEAASDLGQRAVAGEAAVLGVDALEAVDVDQDERERALVALRAAAPRRAAARGRRGCRAGS